MSKPIHTLGVISDTHGLLRAEAVDALRGCERILHAGDVGDPQILDQLRALAPIFAVRGNIDRGEWAGRLPLRETIEIEGSLIYLLHNLQDIDIDPKFAEVSAVISGHTHQPHSYYKDDVLYLNPGSAGPKRFELPITVARLDVRKRPWTPELIHLAIAGR